MRATGRRQPKRNPDRGPRAFGPRCRRAPIRRRSAVQGEGRGVPALRRCFAPKTVVSRGPVPGPAIHRGRVPEPGCPPWPCAWARLSAVAVCLGPAVRRGRVPGPISGSLLVKWCRKLLSCSTYCHQRAQMPIPNRGPVEGRGLCGPPRPKATQALPPCARTQFWFPFGEVVAKTALVQHLSPPTTQTDTRSGACGGAAVEPLWKPLNPVEGPPVGRPLRRGGLWREGCERVGGGASPDRDQRFLSRAPCSPAWRYHTVARVDLAHVSAVVTSTDLAALVLFGPSGQSVTV